MKRKQHTEKVKNCLKRKIRTMKLGKDYYENVQKRKNDLFSN